MGSFDTSFLTRPHLGQIQSPLDSYRKAVTLRDMMDARRIREQQYRMHELAMQETERQRQQDMNLRQLLSQKPDAPFEEVVRVAGVGPALKLETDRRQMQAARTAQKTAELTQVDKEAEARRKQAQHAADVQYALLQLPPEEREGAAWDYAQTDLTQPFVPTQPQMLASQAGAYGAKEAQQLQTNIAARQEAAAKATAEAAQAAAELPGKKAKALGEQWQTAAQTVYGIGDQPSWTAWLAEQPEAIQKALPKQWSRGAVEFVIAKGIPAERRITAAQAAKPNTAPEYAAIVADPNKTPEERTAAKEALKVLERHAQLSRPSVNVNVPSYGSPTSTATGEDFLKTLQPRQAALIRALAEGRETLAGRSSKEVLALKAALQLYDPTYSDQRAAVRRAFITGKEGQNLGNINTAIVHLGRLAHASEAMKNGTFTPANEMYQYLNDKFGSVVFTNFQLLKDAVAGEMAAALKGNATDEEIKNMKGSIRASNSPAQMQGVVKEGMGILSDKAKTYDERYHAQMPDDPWSPILPTAKDALVRFGVPYTGAARKSGGAVPDVKNMSTDELKKRLGIGR